MSGRESWWYEQLESGEIWIKTPKIHTQYWTHDGQMEDAYQMDADAVYDSYVKYVRTSGHFRETASPKHVLSRWLGKLMPGAFPKVIQFGDGTRTWLFPSLDLCRGHWEQHTKVAWNWPQGDETLEGVIPPHIERLD